MKIRYFEKRGTWWLDFKDSTGARRRIPSHCTTQSAAEAAAAALLATALSNPSTSGTKEPPAPKVAPGGMTLEQAFKKGMKTREHWITSKDKASIETTYETVVEYWEATKVCAEVTRANVLEYRSWLLNQPGKRKGSKLSASTVNHKLSMLSVLLEIADVAPHGVKHLSTKGNRRKRRLADDEIAAVRMWLATQYQKRGALSFSALILVALHSAARLSELLNVRWADINLDPADPDILFRDTKNHESRRVPLSAAARQVLQDRKTAFAKTLAGPFADLNEDRTTDLWDQARTALGLEDDVEFVFHSLRHESLSRIADAGENAFVIKDFAGHADITTSQIYVKTSTHSLKRASRVFD